MSFKKIEAHLDEKGCLIITKLPCINHGENVSVSICVTAEENFFLQMPTSANYFFEFKSADGQKHATTPITVVDGKLSCQIKNSVLCCPGEAQVQVIVNTDEGYVFKSSVATFFVAQSINAVDQDFEYLDLLAQLNKLANQTQNIKQQAEQTQLQMQNLLDQINDKLAKGEFVGDKGDKGDKGEKGDTPSLYIQNGVLFAKFFNDEVI